MVTDALIDSFPVTQYDASVAEVLREIADYQTLHSDWDAEDALPMSQETARLAAWLVQMVALGSKHQGVSWHPPVVGPNADGGIDLEWGGNSRQVFLLVRPGQQMVECIIEEVGAQPRRQPLSPWDAIDLALWAISG